jgi:hypothetical protein
VMWAITEGDGNFGGERLPIQRGVMFLIDSDNVGYQYSLILTDWSEVQVFLAVI